MKTLFLGGLINGLEQQVSELQNVFIVPCENGIFYTERYLRKRLSLGDSWIDIFLFDGMTDQEALLEVQRSCVAVNDRR